MRRILPTLAFVLLGTTLEAQTPTTGVNGIVNASNIPDADHYEAFVRTGTGPTNPLVPLSDPATHDPNGDDITEIAKAAGATTQIPLNLWLVGQANGTYTIYVRSVDVNGNAGGTSSLAFQYVAPDPPPLALAFIVVPLALLGAGGWALRRRLG